MSEKNLTVYNGTQTGNFNIYVVRYEENCAYGGERYELYEIADCTIKNQLSQGPVTVTNPKWRNPMIFTEVEHRKLDIKWGKTQKNKVAVDCFLLEKIHKREPERGGRRKKRTRRRKKRRRKRTKKRR